MKKELYIIKIGGNIIDDDGRLSSFLKDFSGIPQLKILVHGGGKLATRLAEKLEIRQTLVDGRRITDAETLKIITMVYAGFINKNIVAQLQATGCDAMGLCGADGNSILAHKRENAGIDYGFAGDIDRINDGLLIALLEKNQTLVFAPVTHDGNGQLLNTNADTIAQEIARALGEHFAVTLIYGFEKEGVLLNADDDNTLIQKISPQSYQELKLEKKIFAGMIPKLDNAFSALQGGVERVIIGKAERLQDLIDGKTGTSITME